jgi:hypothetical protein
MRLIRKLTRDKTCKDEMNVGVKDVENIVRTILEKMAAIKVDRFPRKKNFSETMFVEAKLLAQL